jgi:hypothetical protein
MDAKGRPFIEAASTLDVSGKGARVKDVHAKLAVGDVVGLSSGGQKGRFRVVWVGQAGTPEASHVGLQSLEFKKHLWDLKLPDGSFDTYTRPPQREHRLLTRLKCSLSVEVRSDGGDKQVWAFIKNISMGGCYVAMATPLPVKAKLRIALWLDDETKIWADGIVISSHQASGMGIKFLALSRKNLDALEQFLKLSSDPSIPSTAPVGS